MFPHQNGGKERLPGDPGLTERGRCQALRPARLSKQRFTWPNLVDVGDGSPLSDSALRVEEEPCVVDEHGVSGAAQGIDVERTFRRVPILKV